MKLDWYWINICSIFRKYQPSNELEVLFKYVFLAGGDCAKTLMNYSGRPLY